MQPKKLAEEFDEAMFEVYRRAQSEAGYTATRFLSLLYEHRGLGTARILINAPKESEGYTALWERGHLHLTVEAVIVDNPKWHALFTVEEIENCKRRLDKYRYFATNKEQNR